MGNKFTYGAGRQIYRNGEPFISINREGKTEPCAADDMCVVITDLLNLAENVRKAETGDL